jgi:hypothetical protein
MAEMSPEAIVSVIDRAMRPHFEEYAREAIRKELDTSLYAWVEGAAERIVSRMVDDELRQLIRKRLAEGFDINVTVTTKVEGE